MCIPLGLLKMVVNEVFVQIRSFLSKATCNHKTVGGYMSIVWLSFGHEASMFWLQVAFKHDVCLKIRPS